VLRGVNVGDRRPTSPPSHPPASPLTFKAFRGTKRSRHKALRIDHIRNFCIVAHIDHGKSTLADRLLETTGTLQGREMKEQVLDSMDLERERGITIKLNAIRMGYKAADGKAYEFNLIDTPGHVDFTYEVSRSLQACEGAILVVDASQGVQAQTLSNLFLAMEADLEIIPVLNKVDLPGAEPERRREELVDLLGVDPDDVILASAKEGIGVPEILEAIVQKVPPPEGDAGAPPRALIFDSYYDKYRGAIPSVRVVDGEFRKGMTIAFGSNDAEYEIDEVGYLQLGYVKASVLTTGEVGYISAAIKRVADTKVGDTILDAENRASKMLPGYQEVKPMVFSGLYPTDADQYEDLRDALEKLKLNDASLFYEPETSEALGFGFRCGFLGLLHMEIIRERLEREFDLDLISTVPNVKYSIVMTDSATRQIENPSHLPDRTRVDRIEEPYVRSRIVCPSDYIGNVQKLCHDRRGEFIGMNYLDPQRVEFTFDMPLAEIVLDFYDRLKSATRGYASFDYELSGYRKNDLVKLDMLINGDEVDAFSVIIHADKAYEHGRAMAEKLKELIPRQMFDVALQASIGNRIIARETVKALRKNVTAKCYGGDISRKRKLLEKQKEGKKRMKQVGSVEIPQEAFLAVLQTGS
jgi:GTP-binding protein LepA